MQKTVQQFKAQFKGFLLAQLELVEDEKKEYVEPKTGDTLVVTKGN